MAVKKPLPTLDGNLQMLERFMPAGWVRGVKGGVAVLHAETGYPMDANGTQIRPGGGGGTTGSGGYRDVPCPGDVMPSRASLNLAPGEKVRWLRSIAPTIGPDAMVVGDRWNEQFVL